MRDQQAFPKYLLVGVGNEGVVTWRVQRSSDMAVCGIGRNYVTDDGVDVNREPDPRVWLDAVTASAYITRLEDGTAGLRGVGDEPVVWIPEAPFFTQVDPPHIDGAL